MDDVRSGYRWQLVRSSDKASPRHLAARSSSSQDITALSDRGSESSFEAGPSLHSRLHAGTAGEVERLRSALRQKEDQVASLQSQLSNLEATRDRCASHGCFVKTLDIRYILSVRTLQQGTSQYVCRTAFACCCSDAVLPAADMLSCNSSTAG